MGVGDLRRRDRPDPELIDGVYVEIELGPARSGLPVVDHLVVVVL